MMRLGERKKDPFLVRMLTGSSGKAGDAARALKKKKKKRQALIEKLDKD